MRQTQTDAQFMDALTNLVRNEGISGVTIGELASRLRCSRRRLYAVAPTKEEIFGVVVERYFMSLLDEGDAVIRECKDLTTAIAAYCDVGVRASALLGSRFICDLEASERARAGFDAYQQARAVKLSQLIDQGVSEGVFAACHGLLVSEAMLGAAYRLRQSVFLKRAGLTMEQAFQEFYRVLLGGLLVKSIAPDPASTGCEAPS